MPRAHAKRQGLSLEAARADILDHEAVMGQIQWYCLDYWQEQLRCHYGVKTRDPALNLNP